MNKKECVLAIDLSGKLAIDDFSALFIGNLKAIIMLILNFNFLKEMVLGYILVQNIFTKLLYLPQRFV
jgi:hypothetical protein